MTKKATETLPKLESGLLQAMQALDNQIARAMERSPSELEVSGVQKWKPYAERVEAVSTFLLESFGGEEINLDSLLVLSQVFPKVISILSDELGREGLGELRSSYVLSVLEGLEREAGRAIRNFKEVGSELM